MTEQTPDDHPPPHDHPPKVFQKDEEIHGYYQFLGLALQELLVEKGILSQDEIDAKIAEIRARMGGEEKADG